jgi:uncharacterized protein (TIGR00725 family)
VSGISTHDGLMTDSMLILDRDAGALYDGQRARFSARERRWDAVDGVRVAQSGERVSLAQAVLWLQQDSGHPLREPIGVVGPREATPEQLSAAEAVGAGLAARGYVTLCGGRQGVMEAACRGVHTGGGIAIGLTPDTDPSLANPYALIVLATGIGEARNAIIARASHCLIAVGDSHGTLSEVALGLHFGKRVFGLAGAAQLPGVVRAASVDDALERVDRLVLGLS